MLYNSHSNPSSQDTQGPFDYIWRSMGLPMNDEKEVIRHCHRFLEPLFDSYLLYEDELDVLFSYGFHPDNCVIILCRLTEYSDL